MRQVQNIFKLGIAGPKKCSTGRNAQAFVAAGPSPTSREVRNEMTAICYLQNRVFVEAKQSYQYFFVAQENSLTFVFGDVGRA